MTDYSSGGLPKTLPGDPVGDPVGDAVGDVDLGERRRLAVLARYGIVGAPPPPDLDAIVRLAAHLCRTPQAAVNIIASQEQHQIAALGLAPSVCARSDSMCAVSIKAPEPVLVEDARRDPRFAQNPWVTAPGSGVRFYAASQLHSPEGEALGTLCVFDQEVRSLTDAQRTALDDLAQLVVDVLELHRHRRLLARALHAAEQARTELERSNAALEQFAGRVSHDLKNPLTGITGHSEMLADHPAVVGDESVLAVTRRIERAAARMNETIEAALALARAGGRLRTVPTDLGGLVGEVLEDLQADLSAAGARVEVPDGLPVVVCDRTQVRGLLQNLVANAVKYRAPARPPRIAVRCEADPDGWNIVVADNGIGIPADRRTSVLEPFTQLDPKADGSGIGLATCLRIAIAHGGTLTVGDTPGGGTTVTCHLPYAPVGTG